MRIRIPSSQDRRGWLRGRNDEGEILTMTVPSGPDQPSRGYGGPQPGGHPAQQPQPQPGQQQPGYGAPQQPQPQQPPPSWGQGQGQQQYPQPQHQPQPQYQPVQQQGWGQQPPPPPYGQGGYGQQQPYFPQLPRQTVHFNPVMLLPIHHWIRDRSLRNWITILFVTLVVVPSIALVYVGDDVTKMSKSTWAFAIYFACAWLLVLWIAIRPPLIRPMMLLEVGLIGLIFEAPLAIWLEKKLETQNQGLFAYIFTVGLPEEFVKILPIVVLGLILKNVWGPLTPKDYLFLGAVSGLAFGAAEAVQYINVYIPANSGEIATAAASQGADPSSIGQYIAMTSIQSGSWRFVTDPMSHAVWAGISGYFVGLAFQHRRYFWLAFVGLGLTSVLHGINDDVAGHWFWIVEIVVSVLLFMAYVQAGGVIEQQLTEADEAHARLAGQGYPAGAYAMPMRQPMGAPGWGQGAPPPPAPGVSGTWGQTGGTGAYPAAPTWNPAAGWGHSGFTPLPGYRPPAGGQQPPPA
jgi:RsiW-degrading membrane proteinase PrsW (M82 family)